MVPHRGFEWTSFLASSCTFQAIGLNQLFLWETLFLFTREWHLKTIIWVLGMLIDTASGLLSKRKIHIIFNMNTSWFHTYICNSNSGLQAFHITSSILFVSPVSKAKEIVKLEQLIKLFYLVSYTHLLYNDNINSLMTIIIKKVVKIFLHIFALLSIFYSYTVSTLPQLTTITYSTLTLV